MIVTKDHLESIIKEYRKEHNTFESMGFQDGMMYILEFLNKKTVDKELCKSICFEIYKKGLKGGCDFDKEYKELLNG